MQKRNTMQKQLVLSALNHLRIHATAEEVYAQVTYQYDSISLATVYRNLNVLAQEGAVKKIAVPDGADRFDFQTHRHYHLLCRECGRFEDAPVDYSMELCRQVEERSGFVIGDYDIVFSGMCPACVYQTENELIDALPADTGT